MRTVKDGVLRCYSFVDQESGVFDTPFFCLDDVHAKRHFMMSLSKEGSMLNRFKDSFELHYVGDFDVRKGFLSGIESVEVILKGSQVQMSGGDV